MTGIDAEKILSDFVRETGCDVASSLMDAVTSPRKNSYETLLLDWQGMALTIRFCADWCAAWRDVHGHSLCHIEVISPNGRELPISDTGYHSMFVSSAVLNEWNGPLPYVRFALDCEARRPEWIAAQAKRRQLTLF